MKSWCLMLVCYCICIFKKSTKFKFQINETLNFLHVMRQNTQKSERRSCSQVQCFISMPQRYPKGLKLLLTSIENIPNCLIVWILVFSGFVDHIWKQTKDLCYWWLSFLLYFCLGFWFRLGSWLLSMRPKCTNKQHVSIVGEI